jgi:hypothetical protein
LKRNELKVLLTELGSYVQDECKGDEDKILSSGFEVARQGSPYGILPAPVGLLAKPGIIIGTVLLQWKRLQGARSYVIQMNAADPNVEASWEGQGTSTHSRFIAEGLTSGQVYWFRVRALGAAGEGGQSDPAHSRAQ